MNLEDIRNRFKFHPADTDAKKEAHEWVRGACGWMAEKLDETLVDGREKSLAITKLEEVMFWANASLAREGDVKRQNLQPVVETPYNKIDPNESTPQMKARANVREDNDGVWRAYDVHTQTYWDYDGPIPDKANKMEEDEGPEGSTEG